MNRITHALSVLKCWGKTELFPFLNIIEIDLRFINLSREDFFGKVMEIRV